MLSNTPLLAIASAVVSFSVQLASAAPTDNPYYNRPRWTPLAPIASGRRQEHSVTALGDHLYIIGGVIPDPTNDTNVITVPWVDVYDIEKDRWSQAAPMPVPLNHANAEAARGKIYVLGGLSGGDRWKARGDCFEYDPNEDAWTRLPSMPVGSERGSASTATLDSTIYLAGGMRLLEIVGDFEQDTVATVQSYDVKTGVWKSLPDLPGGRDHGGAAVIDQTLYQVGGRFRGQENVRGTVFSLDLTCPEEESPHWARHAMMPTPRGGISTAAVGHKIYTFGGEGNPAPGSGGVYPDVESYDIRTDSWNKLAAMPVPRHGMAAQAVDGTIYIPGGGAELGGSAELRVNDAFTP